MKSTKTQLEDPEEHRVCYFTGRRETFNPDTLIGKACEYKPGVFHIRLDDPSNDAFWLEFALILNHNTP